MPFRIFTHRYGTVRAQFDYYAFLTKGRALHDLKAISGPEDCPQSARNHTGRSSVVEILSAEVPLGRPRFRPRPEGL